MEDRKHRTYEEKTITLLSLNWYYLKGRFFRFFHTTIVNKINRIGHFGVIRFWIVQFIYKIIPEAYFPKIRLLKNQFALRYLPYLNFSYFADKLNVLEIGCYENLLVYELNRRRYNVFCLDIIDYQEKFPKEINFVKGNILKTLIFNDSAEPMFHFIVCTSVIDLVGTGQYGDNEIVENADRLALENIHKMLRSDGYLIMTVATKFWTSKLNRGYDLYSFKKLIGGLFDIFEMTQINGIICASLVKI